MQSEILILGVGVSNGPNAQRSISVGLNSIAPKPRGLSRLKVVELLVLSSPQLVSETAQTTSLGFSTNTADVSVTLSLIGSSISSTTGLLLEVSFLASIAVFKDCFNAFDFLASSSLSFIDFRVIDTRT